MKATTRDNQLEEDNMADSQRPPQTAGAKDNEQARETLRSLGTALQVGAISGSYIDCHPPSSFNNKQGHALNILLTVQIGMGGLLAGSVGGILKSTEAPTLFAVASGIQWFALGTTFSGKSP